MTSREATWSSAGINSRLAWIVVAAVLPLVALLALNVRTAFRHEQVMAESAVLGSARLISERLDDYVDRVTLGLSLASRLVSPDPAHALRNDSLLRTIKRQLPPYVNNVTAWTPDGTNIGHSRSDLTDTARRNVGDRAYFQRAVSTRRLAIGEPVVSRSTGVWTVAVAMPLLSPDSAVLGVVSVSTQLNSLDRLLAEPAGVPVEGVVGLFGADGTILARTRESERYIGVRRDTTSRIRDARARREGTGIYSGLDGVRRLSGFVSLRQAPWIVFVSQPVDVAFARPRRVLWRDSLLAALVLAIAIVVARRLGIGLGRSLSDLATDATAIGSGDLSRRALVSGPREVRTLASTFNEMALSLSHRQRALEAAEERYRMLFERNSLAMWVVDEGTRRVVDANQAALDQYGYSREEFLALTLGELEVPSLPGGEVTAADWNGTCRHRRKDGRVISVDLTTRSFTLEGVPSWLVLGIDVTERLRLEEQLRQTQKMESIGRLAGGVAHDFNNLLTAILGGAQLALQATRDNPAATMELQMIEGAAQRAADLTGQLLAFARKQLTTPVVADLGAVVGRVDRLLRRVIGEEIELITRVAPGLWPVRADVSQIEQFVINLAINARDAMAGRGHLMIELRNVTIAPEGAKASAELPPGDYVLLAVADTGTGMAPDVVEHLFEPFFTTKPVGEGTGLGLATCYGIVKQNQGALFVDSVVGEGTTFRAYFPRSASILTPVPASNGQLRVLGSETVLLVEDDATVRQLAVRGLEAAGFVTLTANDGKEALSLAQAFPGRIDAVVTDVVMPRMGGAELAREVRRLRPHIPVLFTSGYSEERLPTPGERGEAFLQKPYVGSTLVTALRQLIDRSRGAEAPGSTGATTDTSLRGNS